MNRGVWNVLDYGITGDGSTNWTHALNSLVEKMAAAGGGRLYFPPGEYVSGSITLCSNLTLELESGAVLLASGDPADYPWVNDGRIPGWHEPTHQGILFALGAQNIAVTGRGTIDGRGWNWWHKYGKERPRSLQMIDCQKLLIEGITIRNSPAWTVHPVCCDDVTIHGITIRNPYDSPNTDGINPESCRNLHISDCTVDVGDDCVTLKSGTQSQPFINARPCENITITNCTMVHGHGGVVIGSEMSGGVRNVVISNCVFCGTDRGIRIKTRRLRGGVVEDIRVNNLIMDGVFCPIVVNSYYHCGTPPEELAIASDPGPQPLRPDTPAFRNLYFSNLTVKGAQAAACHIVGLPECPVDGVLIENFTVDMAGEGEAHHPAMDYASLNREGMRAAGLLLSNVENVVLRNLQLGGVEGPLAVVRGGRALTVEGLRQRVPAPAVLRLEQVRGARLRLWGLQAQLEQAECEGVLQE